MKASGGGASSLPRDASALRTPVVARARVARGGTTGDLRRRRGTAPILFDPEKTARGDPVLRVEAKHLAVLGLALLEAPGFPVAAPQPRPRRGVGRIGGHQFLVEPKSFRPEVLGDGQQARTVLL